MPFKDPVKRAEYHAEYKRAYMLKKHEEILGYERDRYKKKRLDDEFMEKRRAKNALYRAKNREKLSQAERDRAERMKAVDLAAYKAKAKASSQASKARLSPEKKSVEAEKQRVRAKANYLKKATDTEFKARNAARVSVWYRANTAQAKATATRIHKARLATDINYKLGLGLRGRLVAAIKNGYHGSSAVKLLGCSIAELRVYLENQFQPGMTWDNWSVRGWHIDHIYPLARLDLTDPQDLARACHYSNLAPLWAADNIRKGARI